MAHDKPNSDSASETSGAAIDPDEAVREVEEAMAMLPKKRLGCLRRFGKVGLVLLVLLAVFVYWNFIRTPALRISRETTYITEPLTSDGTRVDYLAVLERERCTPELKTDDNGYRLIVRALGDGADEDQNKARRAQFYAKLGLDPAVKPTLHFVEPYEFFKEYCEVEGLDEKQAWELDGKVHSPWTLDDLPMLAPWLEENEPVLDLVAEAVRKPVFRFPIVRLDEMAAFSETVNMSEWSRMRSFARMLSARANYRVGTGDIDGAIDDVITCKRLGRYVEGQGTLIERLVGLAIQGIADAIGVAGNPDVQPTAEQLERLVEQASSLPLRPAIDQLVVTERYCALDSIQALARRDTRLIGVVPESEPMLRWVVGVVDYMPVDWNIVMGQINSLFDAMETSAQLEPPPLLSAADLFRALFVGTRSRRVADLLGAMCIPSLEAAREATRRSSCVGNLQRITLAMLLYEREHGILPPAFTADSDGKPLHSWRVLLLPYLGEEELHAKLRLDEPWDSEHNRRFHDTPVGIYQCPSTELSLGQTNYSVVVGKATAFEAEEGKPLDDFGMNLILVVERQQPVCWMDPASEIEEVVALEGVNCVQSSVKGIGSRHPGGMNAGFRSGGVRFVADTTEQPVLQGLLDGSAQGEP